MKKFISLYILRNYIITNIR